MIKGELMGILKTILKGRKKEMRKVKQVGDLIKYCIYCDRDLINRIKKITDEVNKGYGYRKLTISKFNRLALEKLIEEYQKDKNVIKNIVI